MPSPLSGHALPLPLLITGTSGVAGYNALYFFRARYPGLVWGTRQRDNWRLNEAGVLPCDAEDSEELARLCDALGIRAILNCAGNCALKACELDPAMAQRINVQGVDHLLDVVVPRRLRLVHLSIDLVFSGLRAGGYVESDRPDPVTVYGATMAEAEQLVLSRYAAACILRISLPMGVSFNGHAGAIDWIQSRFRQGKPATLYFDEVRTPTYTDCLSRLCEEVLASPLAGLYHAGGPRRLSLYQIAQVVNRVGGYSPELLLGCPRADAGPMPPRAGNVALDSSRLERALGHPPFDPWPHDESFVPSGVDWHRHRTGDMFGSRAQLAAQLYSNPLRTEAERPPFFAGHGWQHGVAGKSRPQRLGTNAVADLVRPRRMC